MIHPTPPVFKARSVAWLLRQIFDRTGWGKWGLKPFFWPRIDLPYHPPVERAVERKIGAFRQIGSAEGFEIDTDRAVRRIIRSLESVIAEEAR